MNDPRNPDSVCDNCNGNKTPGEPCHNCGTRSPKQSVQPREQEEAPQPEVEAPAYVIPDFKHPEQEVDWRSALDRFDEVAESHKSIDPIQEKITVDFNHDGPVALGFGSDLHLGGGFTNHKLLRYYSEFFISRDRFYLGLSGDSIEGFIPGVKPAETIEQQPSSVQMQVAVYRSIVQEMVREETLLWAGWGDHDAKWFEQQIGWNPVKWEIHDTVPYFDGRGIILMEMGDDQQYTVQVNHSERFHSQWNETHPQRRAWERFFPSDVVAGGHKHSPAFQVREQYQRLRDMGFGIGGEHILIQSGTMKTGPDPYTIRSFDGGKPGIITVVFHPDERRMVPFMRPEDAAVYMEGLTGGS